MASVELIGLLCAGSSRYHKVSSGGGVGDQLSKSELAGLLAGMSPAAMALALAKYALDNDAECELVSYILAWATEVSCNEKWKFIEGKPCLVNMSVMAMVEVVRPQRCSCCKGTGVRNMVMLCKRCAGTGFGSISGRHIAQAIGVDECNYRRTWKARYEATLSYVQGIDFEVISALRVADRLPFSMMF